MLFVFELEGRERLAGPFDHFEGANHTPAIPVMQPRGRGGVERRQSRMQGSLTENPPRARAPAASGSRRTVPKTGRAE